MANLEDLMALAAGFNARIAALEIIVAKTAGVQVTVPDGAADTAFARAPVVQAADGEPWRPGIRVLAGTAVTYDGVAYTVIQSHITQADWTPGKAPALFAMAAQPAAGADWRPGTAYQVGDVAADGGEFYMCRQAHTSQAGWEPRNVPALWVLEAGN